MSERVDDGDETKYGPQGLANGKTRTLGEPRRFKLERHEDATGVSGTGTVAYGVQFADGTVAYRWTTDPATAQFADSIEDVIEIHGHGDSTEIVWIDEQRNVVKRGSPT